MAAAGGMSLKSFKDDLPLKFRKMFNIAQEYKKELEYIKSNMPDSVTSSTEIKEQIISNILNDINCMPKYKWELYWTINMPELNDYDRLNMPPDLVNSYDHWKVTIFGSSRFKNYSNWVWIWIYILSIVMLTTYFLNS